MSLPLVAVVGRPNVGKSTLINRLAAKQNAIVHARPGVTRDRNYLPVEWRGSSFTVIDTGGIQFGEEAMPGAIRRQAMLAVEEADLILFVVDREAEVMPDDQEIADLLRSSGRSVLLVVNKVDDPRHEEDVYSFYRLGLGEPIPVSAAHGIGTGDLLDAVHERLPAAEEVEQVDGEIGIAIVGRPNVGKSSLLNRMVGTERTIVTEVPGTTRDAIDSVFAWKGEAYRLIDTAGVRRTSKMDSVEYYGFVRSMRAMDRAQVALLVVDAVEGVTEGESRIANLAESRGCGLVVLLNKWDLVAGDEETRKRLDETYARRMRFLPWVPSLNVSALTGKNVDKIMPVVSSVAGEFGKRIATAKLNGFLQKLRGETDFPGKRGKQLKINYATQARTSPPTFVFFVNDPQLVPASFRSFLERKLRENFGFLGCPLYLAFRS